MKYAEKLNIVFDENIKITKKILGTHGYKDDQSDPVITRKYIMKEDIEKIKNLLPNKVKDKIIAINLSEIEPLKVHVHTKEKVILNIYLNTNDEETVFYDGTIEADDENVIDNGNNFYKVKKEKLKEVQRFSAKKGEAWLLRVEKPHEVVGTKKSKEKRMMIMTYLDGEFDEILKYFYDTCQVT
jgi:hypothetical protein